MMILMPLDNEPKLWFGRFLTYAYLEEGRSIDQAYRIDCMMRRKPVAANQRAPGKWKEAAARWNWVERAKEWDSRDKDAERAELEAQYDESMHNLLQMVENEDPIIPPDFPDPLQELCNLGGPTDAEYEKMKVWARQWLAMMPKTARMKRRSETVPTWIKYARTKRFR